MGGKGSGRKPKPVEQKQRLGNLGKRKLPDTNLVSLPVVQSNDLPEPQRPLGKFGSELWERMWMAGAVWLRPSLDQELMLICCELVDERMMLRARVAQNPDAWRDRRALREIDRQITSILGDLGFSPTDRNNLSGSEGVSNEFAELHKRIAERRAGTSE
jgi:hypothetical protein